MVFFMSDTKNEKPNIKTEPDETTTAAPATAESAHDKASATNKAEPAGVTRAPPSASIMILDSNMDDVSFISRLAAEEGFGAHAISHSAQVLPDLKTVKPIIVFINKHLLKNQDLAELFTAIRSYNAATIIMGRFTSRGEVILFAQLGTADFLTKPLIKSTVSPKIVNALAHAKSVFKRTVEFKVLSPNTGKMSAVEKLKQVMENVKEVMALPQVPARIINLCNLQNTTAETLTKTAESDPSISSILLKRSNSAAYGSLSPIKSLKDAIVRLGFRTIRSIATLTSVFKLTEREDNSFVFNRMSHWVHSLAVGVIAESLARQADFAQSEDVFLAGILHDFGKLIYADYLPEEYAEALRMSVEKQMPVYEAEEIHFAMSHDKVGSELATRWKLPRTICDAIASHHDIKKALPVDDEQPISIASFIYTADQLSKVLLFGGASEFSGAQISPELGKRLGLDAMPPREFLASVQVRVKDYLKWLDIPPERSGLMPPQESSGNSVLIHSFGAPDRMLDFFFANQGLDVTTDAKAIDKPPAFVLYDLRNGNPPTDTTPAAPPDGIPVIVLRGSGDVPPFVPATAKLLSRPFSFLSLLQAITPKSDD